MNDDKKTTIVSEQEIEFENEGLDQLEEVVMINGKEI